MLVEAWFIEKCPQYVHEIIFYKTCLLVLDDRSYCG